MPCVNESKHHQYQTLSSTLPPLSQSDSDTYCNNCCTTTAMHLLDTETLELTEFFDTAVPPYAILSHTWSIPSEEVSLVEMQKSRGTVVDKSGFRKIADFCRIARDRGYNYGWVDTCCIDKRNSADLSEAINSMYRYYYEAGECLIYLADVASTQEWDRVDAAQLLDRLEPSRWFSRGWTLQELIAPKRKCFFARDWTPISQHGDELQRVVARITSIDPRVLADRERLSLCCTAERMSWASRRRTTRSEDIAYSLMGLFNICIPVLYGEGGKRAFRRLQEEIIRTSFDQSIFVWRTSTGTRRTSSGLFAESPADFADTPRLGLWGPKMLTPFSMTNVGLSIKLSVIKTSPEDRGWIPSESTDLELGDDDDDGDRTDEVYIAVVTCDVLNDAQVWFLLGLYLRPVPGATFSTNGKNRMAFRRVNCDTWTAVPPHALSGRIGPNFQDVLVLEDEHYALVQRARFENRSRWESENAPPRGRMRERWSNHSG